jgi:hypothetical protein
MELSSCDGTSNEVIQAMKCSVPIAILRSSPFNHKWGASIFAKVMAQNAYGNSVLSLAGNGAQILTSPDVPLNLQEITELKTATSISLIWSEGIENGGAAVLDYVISFTIDTVFSVLASSVT